MRRALIPLHLNLELQLVIFLLTSTKLLHPDQIYLRAKTQNKTSRKTWTRQTINPSSFMSSTHADLPSYRSCVAMDSLPLHFFRMTYSNGIISHGYWNFSSILWLRSNKFSVVSVTEMTVNEKKKEQIESDKGLTFFRFSISTFYDRILIIIIQISRYCCIWYFSRMQWCDKLVHLQ